MTGLDETTFGPSDFLARAQFATILYRMEDDGLIQSRWSQGEGRNAPKKFYEATSAGHAENNRRKEIWQEFQNTVEHFLDGESKL